MQLDGLWSSRPVQAEARRAAQENGQLPRSIREDGAVLYRLRKADKRGRTVLVLSPHDFLARLSAILPAPRFSLRREVGVFAPGHKARAKVVPTRPKASTADCHAKCCQPAPPLDEPPAPASDATAQREGPPAVLLPPPELPPKESAAPTRVPWAVLLLRTRRLDGLRCPRCFDGRMVRLAVVKESAEVERYLRHVGLFTPLHPSARARGPPLARSHGERPQSVAA